MSEETNEEIKKLMTILHVVKENTNIQNNILGEAQKIKLIYSEILLEQKRTNKILEQLKESKKLVSVS